MFIHRLGDNVIVLLRKGLRFQRICHRGAHVINGSKQQLRGVILLLLANFYPSHALAALRVESELLQLLHKRQRAAAVMG